MVYSIANKVLLSDNLFVVSLLTNYRKLDVENYKVNGKELTVLANEVLNYRVLFDVKLHEDNIFPIEEFETFWLSINRYAEALGDSEFIHRRVANVVSGLREYLELESFNTPSEVLAKADRIENIIFSRTDPYFKGFDHRFFES